MRCESMPFRSDRKCPENVDLLITHEIKPKLKSNSSSHCVEAVERMFALGLAPRLYALKFYFYYLCNSFYFSLLLSKKAIIWPNNVIQLYVHCLLEPYTAIAQREWEYDMQVDWYNKWLGSTLMFLTIFF